MARVFNSSFELLLKTSSSVQYFFMGNKKLKLWDAYHSWEHAETAWDQKAKELSKTNPLKTLSHHPKIPGITKKTLRFLRLKSVIYLLKNDKNKIFYRFFWKHPFKYSWNLLKSYFKKKSFLQEKDFFIYNLPSVQAFEQKIKNSLLVVGFSYCHKPFECPSGRFTDQCIHEQIHPVCRQCFIGKSMHALPTQNVKVFFIPTVHYIGERLFELLQTRSEKSFVFLITACELTLRMFSDWGNMLGIQGIGVRLDGRVCNTMKAFKLSEGGIKPGLTTIQKETEKKILKILKNLRTFK
jgi:hypothetical protein